jgi:DNA-binding transcriptional ArsR family regulator
VPRDPAGEIFDALGDTNRRELVALLAARDTATATELAGELDITRQGVSKHLGTLQRAGLVRGRRRGRETRYRLTPGPLGDAMAWMATVGGQWDERLEALQSYLDRG